MKWFFIVIDRTNQINQEIEPSFGSCKSENKSLSYSFVKMHFGSSQYPINWTTFGWNDNDLN